jgi:methylthioribose-1-phosphate isomerase
MLPTIKWEDDKIIMVDQRKLPAEEVYIKCLDYTQVAEAIETMVIRGAPAIGVAAAFGVALGVKQISDRDDLDAEFARVYRRLERTRPTARNLFWALEQMNAVYKSSRCLTLPALKQKLIDKALTIEKEDISRCRKIGSWGKSLLKKGQTILTHCNAGALATAGYGTALGVIRAAFDEYEGITVYAGETRPFLQGARLTCWELTKDNIPVTLITDNMAGCLMRRGEISVVVTGADRIASNGDTANKIGTYSLAVLAQENNIPMYIAAPLNTVDFSLSSGEQIPIEERDADEVRKICGCDITLPDIKVRNPSFDVTPAEYISAIITECGIAYPTYKDSLEKLR